MYQAIEDGTEEVYQEERFTLLPGGRLEFAWLDTESEAVQIADVTGDAAAFLFTPVRLAADLRLGDVFLLLQQSPALIHIFSRDGAAELLDEVFGGEAPTYTDEYDPLGIEGVFHIARERPYPRLNELKRFSAGAASGSAPALD